MWTLLKSLSRSRCGATAIEYGLIAALIGGLTLVAVQTLGKKTNAQLSCTSTVVKRADTIKRPDRFMKRCKANRSNR